jgi:hypothetical protein
MTACGRKQTFPRNASSRFNDLDVWSTKGGTIAELLGSARLGT